MRIVTTVDRSAFGNPAAFGNWVRMQLILMVAVNRGLIAKRAVSSLYASGVRYREESPGVETFVDALTCQRAGHGDCAHLASWRCAELRQSGVPAEIRIRWKHPIYHVVVRLPHGRFPRAKRDRYGVWIEDPSAELGMPSSD